MKKLCMILIIPALSLAPLQMPSQTMGPQEAQNLKPGAWISVMTEGARHRCQFVSSTSRELVCRTVSGNRRASPAVSSGTEKGTYETFNWANIASVSPEGYDWSKGIDMLGAVGGGGGLDSNHQPTMFAGVKVGLSYAALDLQYDRVQAHSGFSTEGSAVIPLFRVPRFRWDEDRTFIRIYAEPGFGYRAGNGPFGGYSSAKVMAVLLTDNWSEKWVAPYVEFQRRFPFESPLQGDNRLTIGLMHISCGGCTLP
jgi:hypothetical protein